MREICSFIVRVYRRDAEGVAGVVEDVQSGCIHSFHSPQDLWHVLAAAKPAAPSHERKAK